MYKLIFCVFCFIFILSKNDKTICADRLVVDNGDTIGLEKLSVNNISIQMNRSFFIKKLGQPDSIKKEYFEVDDVFVFANYYGHSCLYFDSTGKMNSFRIKDSRLKVTNPLLNLGDTCSRLPLTCDSFLPKNPMEYGDKVGLIYLRYNQYILDEPLLLWLNSNCLQVVAFSY